MAQTSFPARGGEIRPSPRPAAARSGPVVLMPRRVPGGVLATLDALPAEALPRMDYEGPVSGLRRAMRASLAARLPRPRWLANWLLDDVLDHAALMAELTGAPALRAVLDAPGGGPDRSFAAAAGRCRLVTAYRGAGFDWLPPRAAAGLPGGEAPPASLLRRLPRGDVAVFRGGADPGARGVAHRAASGPGTPLLLTIDAAGTVRRPAAACAERPAGRGAAVAGG
ncbi:DUF1826 domain-containing protein [Lichenibacterium dinghuense]|uniref:DUF1826 domain-containing protein n=1 Tax=Lichenibacterium dinghuense TaxID=2895977 RepID=UPI001F1D0751|nr:DUF1826 domain-containing protein [Lichenibacterium sp. 6Y81]